MPLRSWPFGLLVVSLAGGCSSSNAGGALPPEFEPGEASAPGASAQPSAGAGAGGATVASGALDRPSTQPMQMAAGTGGSPAAAAAGAGGGAQPGPMAGSGGTGSAPSRELSNVLVFSRTAGFRHDSIPAGIEAIRRLGQTSGFAVQATEDPAAFTDQGLAPYQVVVWLSTTQDVLSAEQQGAFERFVGAGNGWVGVHAAADTEYDWPWYGALLGNGAWFRSHPMIQTAEVVVEQASHPSTAHFAARFNWQDELYNFRANPRPDVTVLLRLNEASYQIPEGAMGEDHPIAWYHEYAGGRAWYTGLGHRIELYTDPAFVQHLLGGIRWAAGVVQ